MWRTIQTSAGDNQLCHTTHYCQGGDYQTTATSQSGFRCKVIAPVLLNAIIHKSVSRLKCYVHSSHPSAIDIYKLNDCDTIYTSLPYLRNLRCERLGKADVDWDELGYKFADIMENLEEFSSARCSRYEAEILSETCRGLKTLDVGCALYDDISPFLKFEQLEELNLCNVLHASPPDVSL